MRCYECYFEHILSLKSTPVRPKVRNIAVAVVAQHPGLRPVVLSKGEAGGHLKAIKITSV
jgi:hypothetical protein